MMIDCDEKSELSLQNFDIMSDDSWAQEDFDDDGFVNEDNYVVDSDGDDIAFEATDPDAIKQANLETIIHALSAYLPQFKASSPFRGGVHVEIPSSILPLSMRSVYGYMETEILIEIDFELNNYDWQSSVVQRTLHHPIFGVQFIGRPLVEDLFSHFFSMFYEPKSQYLSQSYVLTPNGIEDEAKVSNLVSQGYSEIKVRNALRLTDNDLKAAVDFLMTGDLPQKPLPLEVSYIECPLLYFVLEVGDIFLNLGSRCCVCGDPLAVVGLRPTACDKEVCQFSLEQFGVGTSVTQEIKRDPMAADLLVSLFSAALDTKFLTPKPPSELLPGALTMLSTLPPMRVIAESYNSDSQLKAATSAEAVALLRWILLSCKSQFISLPKSLQVPQFPSTNQFLALLSSPSAEAEFRARKTKHQSIWLWHGSGGERWHSIVRNGLRNLTGTALQANGAALGEGIYFAPDSNTSFGYVREVPNKYKASALGSTIRPIALCEVAKTSGLKSHGWAYTLTDEQSCIVRMLIIGNSFSADVTNNKLKIPSLRDIMEYRASVAKADL